MRKNLLLLSLPLLALGLLRLCAPLTLFRFAGLDSAFAVAAIAVAGVVLLLTSPLWDWIDFRRPFAVAAGACLLLAIIILNTPTLWGMRTTYLSLLDIFVVGDSALLFAQAALQPKRESLPVFTAIVVFTQLLVQRLRKASPQLGQGWAHPHYNS